MGNDLEIVQKYIDYIVQHDLTYKFPMCPVCVDSELPLYPWSDGDNAGLFCLVPKCKYRVSLGLDSLFDMREDLKKWRVPLSKNA